MGNIIFPTDDMSAYRINAPASISDEDEESLFKGHDQEQKSDKYLSEEDKKIYLLIVKKKLLENFGINIGDTDIDFPQILAYALLKKDLLRPAIQTLGIKKKKYKQDWSNRLFRLALSLPGKKKLLNLNIEKISSSDIPKKLPFPKR